MTARALFTGTLIWTAVALVQHSSAQPTSSPPADQDQSIRALERDLERAQAQLKEMQSRRAGGDRTRDIEAAENIVKSLEAQLQELRPVLKIYRLQHAQADQAASLFREFFRDRNVRVAVNARLNHLIVHAPGNSQDELAAILQAMDVPQNGGSEVRVYRLAAKDAAKQAIDKLKELKLAESWSTTSSGDGGTELRVTAASAEKVGEIEKVLKQVEEQARPKSRRIRVVWLVSDLADPKPIPDDIKPVITELEKFGVPNMSVAAQTSVRTLGKFNISSVATLERGTAPTRLSVDGYIGPDVLNISLHAQQLGDELARISTSIDAPLGHPVVLGVSPMNAQNSAFVVTVYDGQ